jgi:hypothetical protein
LVLEVRTHLTTPGAFEKIVGSFSLPKGANRDDIGVSAGITGCKFFNHLLQGHHLGLSAAVARAGFGLVIEQGGTGDHDDPDDDGEGDFDKGEAEMLFSLLGPDHIRYLSCPLIVPVAAKETDLYTRPGKFIAWQGREQRFNQH